MTTTKEQRVAAIDEAIQLAGGIVRFCKVMNIRHQSVYGWRNRGWVPPERALHMERLFNIPREELMNPSLVAALTGQPPAGDDLL